MQSWNNGVTRYWQVLNGDCIEMMRALPGKSVHTCITSPPYFGLRDYGVDGQLGLEPTPDEFVQALVAVFREVRRVLRDDGTLWLNLGDSYSSGGRKTRDPDAKLHQRGASFRAQDGLPEKNLIGIPWRVAFALQADGWYLRQDCIWHKPNPIPESVRDRCTKAHEYVFLLSKSADYFFDHKAIKEPVADSTVARLSQKTLGAQAGSSRVPGKTNGNMKAVGGKDGMRNRRSVWTVTTQPFKGAHFATFPPDLIRPCVLAGAPIGGTVLDPFGGSGTTGAVAMETGRFAILCELNPEYAAMAAERTHAALVKRSGL